MSGDIMGQIMGNIHQVVNDKVDKGEINRDNMVKEAQNICNNLDAKSARTPSNNIQKDTQTSNKTKARLQKKLKEREKMKVNNEE